MAEQVDEDNVTVKATPTIRAGPDLDLIMIGMTGDGKSSTGNSILGIDVFGVGVNGDATTRECRVGRAEVDGRVIKVTDTPGLIYDSHAHDEQIIEAMKGELDSSLSGINALLLVLPYHPKITGKDLQAVKTLKRIFGDDAVARYTVFIFTHGDIFNEDVDNNYDNDFMKWCKNQNKEFFDLFVANRLRCVLFDNNTQDEFVKKSQLVEMISLVDGLRERQSRYSIDNLQAGMDKVQSLKIRDTLNEQVTAMNLLLDEMQGSEMDPEAVEFSQLRSQIRRLQMFLLMNGGDELSEIKKSVDKILATTVNIEDKSYYQKRTKKNKKMLTSAIISLKELNTNISDQANERKESRKKNKDYETETAMNNVEKLQKEKMKELDQVERQLNFAAAQSNKLFQILQSVLQSKGQQISEETKPDINPCDMTHVDEDNGGINPDVTGSDMKTGDDVRDEKGGINPDVTGSDMKTGDGVRDEKGGINPDVTGSDMKTGDDVRDDIKTLGLDNNVRFLTRISRGVTSTLHSLLTQ